MKKIFLIDDDADDRELFEMALKTLELPTEFVYAANGEDALELAINKGLRTPDYIFLDLNMPKLSGLEVLKHMRVQNIYQGIPVFIYTTSSAGLDIDKCVELDAMLMTKHSSFTDLCSDLKKLLV